MSRLCGWGGILTTSLTICSLTFGQQFNTDSDDPLAQYKLLPAPSKPTKQAFEGVIDPAQYLLGPGDKLNMTVWGKIELSFELTVSPEGSVAIPGIGRIELAGITIADAEKTVIERSLTIYPKSTIKLNLVEIRLMRASISGAVVEPGLFMLTAIDRLSTLVLAAGGFIIPEEESEKVEKPDTTFQSRNEMHFANSELASINIKADPMNPSLRKISVKSQSGEITNVDYLKYLKTGNLQFNPVVRDGDQVFIPFLERDVGVVYVLGAVKQPGEYEFLEGDNLLDVIEIASGFRTDASLSNIVISRFSESNPVSREIIVDLTKEDPESRGPQLFADDRVFVRHKADYHLRSHVIVSGEVRYPGVYPIENNVTKLTEIIKRSGDFTERADLLNSSVSRAKMTTIIDLEFERLLGIPINEMTSLEYEYFKLKSRGVTPKVIVDFEKLFKENELNLDITLNDKDIINVSTLNEMIHVSGCIKNPGLVNYESGKNFKYYIAQTGGFCSNADIDGARLIKARTGVWFRLTKKTEIEIGDTIFIPEKEEIDWWEFSKDILLVVSQMTTIFVVVYTLR